MSTFPLRVGTPDGLLYEGDVARVVCRTISGDLAILPGHCNYCTALGMGEAHIVLEDGTRRNAACIGGMLSMMNGVCRVLATTWEWEEDIDAERAEACQTQGRAGAGKRRSDGQRIPYCRSQAAACAGAVECKRIKNKKPSTNSGKSYRRRLFLFTGNFVEISCVSLKSKNSAD